MTGWVRFAAILLILAGAMNVIHGFTLLDHKHFVANQLDFANFTFWGVVFLIGGVVQIGAGVAVFGRRLIGYQVGVVLAIIAPKGAPKIMRNHMTIAITASTTPVW